MSYGLGVWSLVAVVSTAAVWKGSEWLEQSSSTLAAYYGLPALVQGAIIAAIGSSFPEISSTVIATLLHGEFNLGVGAVVGSAIFNILVIPALAGLFGEGVSSSRDIAYKEAQFYMVAVSALTITFALAVIYNPIADQRLGGTITPGLAVLPLGLYAVYLFTQQQEAADATAEAPPTDVNPLKQWGLLIVSLVVIAGSVEGLVKAALHFGEALNTPSFLWGITLIAAATSLPDALVSIKKAKAGEGVTSLANVFGSNTFDLLVAVPLGVIVAGGAAINFAAAVPMMGFLTAATIVVFAFIRTDLHLSQQEAYALLSLYAGFVVWMVLETIGVLNWLPGA